LHPQHTTPRTRAQFHRSAASGSRRHRREFVTAGEGQSLPPFFLSSWVHQGLIKLGLLQVLVPGARGSCASTTPEHRPTRRRCQALPPSHPLRFRTRLLLFRTVRINPRLVSLLLVHFGGLTSSSERPLRPLLAPVAGEARSPPLTPRSRAHASPLRFVLSCGCVSGRERRPGATPASSRRAPPHSGVLAAASRTHTSRAARSCACGSDRIPLRV
jgi:hypothetical protein